MRIIKIAVLAAVGVAIAMAVPAARAAPPRPMAVFPVELWDASGEGSKPGQAERLELATSTLTQQIEGAGVYRSIDLAPYAAKIAATEPRYGCNGCWRDVAREAGAEVAVVAFVQKISTLISIVDILVADLKSGAVIARADGQFRGDDDRAYVRAFEFLVKERLNRN